MKKNVILVMLFFVTMVSSQTIINIGIGPSWPADTMLDRSSKKTVWNGTVEYGKIFDKIIGIGVDVDFSWWINDEYKDSAVTDPITNETGIVSKKISDDKFFMFPISAVIFVDPIPKYRLHPVIRAQIGFNMMTRDREELSANDKMVKSVVSDGFYVGIIGKGGADAVFDIGDHAALFAGFEYQWGKLRHKITEGALKDSYTYFKFNAPMIRMGISVLF